MCRILSAFLLSFIVICTTPIEVLAQHGIEDDGSVCAPGSADIRGAISSYDPFYRQTQVNLGSGDRKLTPSAPMQLYLVAPKVSTSLNTAIIHKHYPLIIDKWSLQSIDQVISRSKNTNMKITTESLQRIQNSDRDGFFYPQIFKSKILFLWKSYIIESPNFTRDYDGYLRDIENYRRIALDEGLLDTPSPNPNRLDLALAYFHAGLLAEAADLEISRTAELFHEASRFVDRECTPKLAGMIGSAHIEYLIMNESSKSDTYVLLSSLSEAVSRLPFHENPFYYCLSARRLKDALNLVSEDDKKLTIAPIESACSEIWSMMEKE